MISHSVGFRVGHYWLLIATHKVSVKRKQTADSIYQVFHSLHTLHSIGNVFCEQVELHIGCVVSIGIRSDTLRQPYNDKLIAGGFHRFAVRHVNIRAYWQYHCSQCLQHIFSLIFVCHSLCLIFVAIKGSTEISYIHIIDIQYKRVAPVCHFYKHSCLYTINQSTDFFPVF